MALSSGYSSWRRLTIARGDQRFRSFSMMYRRRRSSHVNRLLPCLREEARRFARFPAENARYPLLPLLCCTSRETVLGARPNRLAIAERPVPCARPRLTSSRSADESRRYGVVVCIRIHSTHIRCVRCLTPRFILARRFSLTSLSNSSDLIKNVLLIDCHRYYPLVLKYDTKSIRSLLR